MHFETCVLLTFKNFNTEELSNNLKARRMSNEAIDNLLSEYLMCIGELIYFS